MEIPKTPRLFPCLNFKLLYESVSDLFAQCLRSDMEMLRSKSLYKISLAAKWCPSLDSSFDKITLPCETITKKVFPGRNTQITRHRGDALHVQSEGSARKEVLVSLRKVLDLPEIFMVTNDWGSPPYNRLAYVAMKTYKGEAWGFGVGAERKAMEGEAHHVQLIPEASTSASASVFLSFS